MKKISKIGNVLKKYRKEAGLTQKEVADKVEITQSRYSNYENGYSIPPTDLFRDLAHILNFDSYEYIDVFGVVYDDKTFKEEYVKGYQNDIEQLLFFKELYEFRHFIDNVNDFQLRRNLANNFSLFLHTLGQFESIVIGKYNEPIEELNKIKQNYLKKIDEIINSMLNDLIQIAREESLSYI